ncbi:MAG: tRNA pseudouridine(38-40) synthase TruA [Ruminococcaceae bacterium]|nr:tRNA pseudouridine(38-40) synthase TruA [Oscillospiraceae bacterium]
MEKNYKLTIAYDGTRFFGWERQPDRETIQGKLEGVLEKLNGAPVDVIGAGRTDAGVHARAMVASVRMDVKENCEEIRDYMNRYLPDAIAVREVKEAGDRFHARYNALGKTYRYTCFDGPVKPVFDRRYVTMLDYRPDVEKMRAAAAILTGEHDFRSFCGNPRMKKSTVRMVDSIVIERNKDRITFTFHGTGFLQNMVRILVGTLLEVGRGYWDVDYVQTILDAKDRKQAGPTAPPEGLCLMKVDY